MIVLSTVPASLAKRLQKTPGSSVEASSIAHEKLGSHKYCWCPFVNKKNRLHQKIVYRLPCWFNGSSLKALCLMEKMRCQQIEITPHLSGRSDSTTPLVRLFLLPSSEACQRPTELAQRGLCWKPGLVAQDVPSRPSASSCSFPSSPRKVIASWRLGCNSDKKD